ncbi:uncharacterized protein LOC129918693 [Episyrphus balteatus]|uniref:uncharacterized protein LOC129918693 n=1 Tax=Episyrphus balteatus TaxID=286459 RepID=UPI0024865EEC|nr:uncharacterized protein LOC129918693 [Episyrphus balteatus]
MHCAHCNRSFISIKLYSMHFKKNHPGMQRFTCYNKSCGRVFSVLYKHIAHIKRNHVLDFTSPLPKIVPSINNQFDNSIQYDEIETNSNFISTPQLSSENDVTTDLLKVILKTLNDDRIPRSTALEIFKNLFSFYDRYLSLAMAQNKNNEEIYPILTSLMSPKYLKSEFLILKKLSNMNILVNFHDIFLGSEYQQVYSADNEIKITKCDFFLQIVDLNQLFTVFFTQTPLLKLIEEYINHLQKLTYTIVNITQTPLWEKKKRQFNPENDVSIFLIPLLIYFDDFEYLNPLGSHSGIQKIGAVYIKILSLPDNISSKLSHTLLAMLFFTEDRKKFGNTTILKPLIEYLNSLQNIGLNISYKNFKIIKLIPCLITGDNLGLNSLLGFTESFNSLHYCRFCRCSKENMKSLLIEDGTHLRNESNYDEDINIGNAKITGIKENSIWNSLNNFHVVDNLSADCMHDLLEGVCHYDLSIILKSFILKYKYFSLPQLNRRIEIFNFGSVTQKPPLFNSDSLSKNKFKLSASEMYIIITHLSLLVGDLVENSCPEWKLYLLLREIILFVFRKRHHIHSTEYLKKIIADHNSLYILISESHLKPKFHFLLHYPRIVQNIGPIVAVNSMRFEAKHQTFKKCGYISNNRINILKTMNVKHQYKISNLILNYNELCLNFYNHGQTFQLKSAEFFKFNFKSSERENILKVSWLNHKGVLFKEKLVVCIGLYENNDPVFRLIEHIVKVKTSFYLCLSYIETICFDNHYFAYKIKANSSFSVFDLDSLQYVHTSSLSMSNNGDLFVIWDF